MIFSSINSKDDFTSYPKAVQRAIKYLKENDFVNMEPGVYELEGKLMYAQVFDAETGSVNEKRPEVHEKYLDVQFLACLLAETCEMMKRQEAASEAVSVTPECHSMAARSLKGSVCASTQSVPDTKCMVLSS